MDCLDLDLAFERVWRDKRDDAWPDVVGHHDFRKDFAQARAGIEEALREPTQYRPRTCVALDVPKKGFTLRPGLVPCIQDRIIYQAIADLYAPHFRPEPGVYSNRLAGARSKSMFEPGVRLWKVFQDTVEENCDEYEFVVETDITAYFDHVFHRLLSDRVEDLLSGSIDRDALQASKTLLRRLLGSWSGPVLREFGMPQINDASSLFGNLYLDEFDKWASAHRYLCLRYVDDIRIFTHNEADARRALADVVVKLRDMGLYVASAKTRIRASQEAAMELSRRRAVTTELEAAFDSRDRQRVESVVPRVEELFTNLLADQGGVDDRLFRYCVNRLKRLKAWGLGDARFYEDAVMEVIGQLRQAPQSTDTFVDFLSAFSDSTRMQSAVLDFLDSPYSLYPWQQMHLLELLVRCDLAEELKDRVNVLACAASQPRHHPACRSKAIILRGKNGTYADRREIRDQYRNEHDHCVRRAIVVAVQELQRGVRDNFYRRIEGESPAVRSTVGYVRSLPEPTYHYYRPPVFPDLVDEDSDDYPDLGSDYFA